MHACIPTARAVLLLLIMSGALVAQSLEQNAPTTIAVSEVRASILPRVAGDPRLTEHFYSLKVGQGDLFVNLTHRNFIGDLDIFSIDGRRPLAKLTIVRSDVFREIGRVVFIRSPGEILLRVQGRSPDDDEAIYRLKFGGTAWVIPSSGGVLDFGKGTVAVDKAEALAQVESTEKVEEISTAKNGDPLVPPSDEGIVRNGIAIAIGTDAQTMESPKAAEGLPKQSEQKFEIGSQSANPGENHSKVIERRLTLKIEFDDGEKLERPLSAVDTVAIERNQLVIKFANGAESRYPISSVIRFTVD